MSCDCRLICSDVDGTLVSSDKKISEENKRWIRRVVEEQHVPFAIVSGRLRGGVTPLRDALGIDVPLCCFNGAYIEVGGKMIHSDPITIEQARKVLRLSQAYGVECLLFDLDMWYVQPNSEWYDIQKNMYGADGIMTDQEKLLDQWEKEGHVCYKALPKSRDKEKLARLRATLEQQLGNEMHIFSSSPVIIETGTINTDKAHVVNILSDYYHIHPSQVMAFGDYENDIGMLKASGISVAMGNGTEQVKEVATYVTTDCDHDGIAHAIKHFFYDKD